MKDQLKMLEELQRHDAALLELDNALKAIPEKVKAMRGNLGRVEELLESERRQLAETERWRSDQEQALRNEEQLTQKAKVKLQGVKNSKEYMATQRELESTRKMVQDREEEVLKVLGAVEDFKKNIAAHEADVNLVREEVAKEEKLAQERMDELEKKVAEAKAARTAVSSQVRPEILRRYSSIKLRRGLAVVPVKNGTCQGCNMNIPPQLYNMLQRGQTIETCPNCNRVIYWDKLMEESGPATGETGGIKSGEQTPNDP